MTETAPTSLIEQALQKQADAPAEKVTRVRSGEPVWFKNKWCPPGEFTVHKSDGTTIEGVIEVDTIKGFVRRHVRNENGRLLPNAKGDEFETELLHGVFEIRMGGVRVN